MIADIMREAEIKMANAVEYTKEEFAAIRTGRAHPAIFAKLMAVAFLMFWVRFTYPRLREDQLQALAWKFLIPIALLNILATGVLKVAFT